ncbi:MAG: nitrile hydratase accessory protein [Pseudonocardia sp. SCN 72-86]|nr:MAG: nitrile hydratase accessory protein [Pseudonocardia sp. SCN 72-86]
MRTDATEIADARRRVEELVCDLPGGGVDERAFAEPWELRAFAMAVAVHHAGRYEWTEFQLSLVEAITKWEEGGAGEPWSYYEHWLTAFETVLADNGVLSDAAVDDRTREVLAVPRNANHHEAHREPVAVSPARR